MPEILTEDALSANLRKCPAWELEGDEITRTLEFETFLEAVEFVNDLAEIAEESQHHPDIDIRYSKVTLRLTTHHKKGLTDLDFEMAQRIDNLVD